jgi:hypothetical protein
MLLRVADTWLMIGNNNKGYYGRSLRLLGCPNLRDPRYERCDLRDETTSGEIEES